MNIAGFLRGFPPFDALPQDQLQAVASSVEIEHMPQGRVILRQGGEPAAFLFVIRKGAVELLDGEAVLDLLGEGEVFGQFSLLWRGDPTVSVRAHEDTLCYLIPAALAEDVLGSSSGRAFVMGSMRRRIRAATESARTDGPDPRLRTVGELVRRAPVTTSPSTPTAEAAALMAAERVSCLLIPVAGGWGIVTDRDLRTRVVAARGAFDAPIESVATVPAISLPSSTTAGDALLRMFAAGLHHFPVAANDGTILGVVTDTDLMGQSRHTPFALKSAIMRAPSADGVAAAGRDLPELVVTMVEARADAIDVGRVVALAVDAMTERLLVLAQAEVGAAPCAWTWLALGSAARHEQALKTDQDHALAYADVDPADADVDPAFARIAEFVTAGLEAAGIPRCAGDAMAVHPTLRRPIGAWREMFDRWATMPDPKSSVLASIGFDVRQVAGPLDARPVLTAAMQQAARRPAFLHHLAARALDHKPPTGFFRDFVVEHEGEHAGRLDIKHRGIAIITSLARAWSIQAGAVTPGTLARLDAATGEGVIDAEMATELAEAFRFLWDVRLRHQVDQVRNGAAPDDFVDPATLGPVARSGLKEAFAAIGRAQRVIELEMGLSPR